MVTAVRMTMAAVAYNEFNQPKLEEQWDNPITMKRGQTAVSKGLLQPFFLAIKLNTFNVMSA